MKNLICKLLNFLKINNSILLIKILIKKFKSKSIYCAFIGLSSTKLPKRMFKVVFKFSSSLIGIPLATQTSNLNMFFLLYCVLSMNLIPLIYIF